MKVDLGQLRRIILGDETLERSRTNPQKSLFHVLYTEEGFTNLKEFFSKRANDGNALGEKRFIKIILKVLDFKDIEMLKLFDIFDRKQNGTIELREFFLLFSMLAAREEGQTTECLYLHGREFFELLNTPNPSGRTLNFERFTRLGFVAGIPDEYIAQRLKEFGVGTFDALDYDIFMLCYFDLLCKLDNYSRRKNNVDVDSTGPEGKRCIIS